MFIQHEQISCARGLCDTFKQSSAIYVELLAAASTKTHIQFPLHMLLLLDVRARGLCAGFSSIFLLLTARAEEYIIIICARAEGACTLVKLL